MDARDSAQVTVVVLGHRGVGKTTFISRCLDLPVASLKLVQYDTVHICGKDIKITIVDSPDRHQLVPAAVVIVLFDITDEGSFRGLKELLDLAQRVSPAAMRAVVGTKADLQSERAVATADAVAFCQQHADGSTGLPYYETTLNPSDSIVIAFQEIVARPLISEYLTFRASTEQEVLSFVHETMQWSILNNSANILSFLRERGFAVPPELIEQYPQATRDYFFSEYPLRSVPKFLPVELEEAEVDEDALSLDEYEDPVSVVDARPTLQLQPAYCLQWSGAKLTLFRRFFLEDASFPVRHLTHVDLSHNQLTEVPVEFFRLPNLESLNLAHNLLSALPAIERWSTRIKLQVLIASHNLINGDAYSPVMARKHTGAKVPFQDLWYLDMSYNMLVSFPLWVFHFPMLRHLDLQYNAEIKKLPSELCLMEHLSSLIIEGITFSDPPPVVAGWGPSHLLRYLRLKRSSSTTWNSLRLVVVGPRGSGKTCLVSKLRGEGWTTSSPTKGLEIVEWKYKGSDLFSFRNKWFTFDLWDFSGDPDCHSIYSCFRLSSSLHLVVCSALDGLRQLTRWLSDIQAPAAERVPVIVVFTHMDGFRSREQSAEFKRKVTQWLDYVRKQAGDVGGGAFPMVSSSMHQNIRSLQGDEMVTSYSQHGGSAQRIQEAFDMQDLCAEVVPLVPAILKVHFVNNITGDGVTSIRKHLYKFACGAVPPPLSFFRGFQILGQQIPSVYASVEHLVRQLRKRSRYGRREGEQRPFLTVPELRARLQRPLEEGRIGDEDFEAALHFLHEYGFVFVHRCHDAGGTQVVAVDPQLVGYLLQRMIRASLLSKEASAQNSPFLPVSHLFMLWGVDSIWSAEPRPHCFSSEHLLDFLYHLNVCTPLIPGLSLMPALLSPTLPPSSEPDTSALVPRRVYILSYLPWLLPSQLSTRLLSALVDSATMAAPTSPGGSAIDSSVHATPTEVPIRLPSGEKLYLWQRNLVLVDEAGSKLWVKVSEGKEVGPNSMPFCGRIDVALDAEPQKEARWLLLVTKEIDYLLEHEYPSLLDPESSTQVEIFVPLGSEWQEGSQDFGDEPTGNVAMPTSSPTSVPNGSSPGGGAGLAGFRKAPSFMSTQSAGAVATMGAGPGGGASLEGATAEHSSWEVLSRQSSSSTRLSLVPDGGGATCLVPLWEAIGEAFKSPLVRLNGQSLVLRDVIPDLLFVDLPPELIYRMGEDPAADEPYPSPPHPPLPSRESSGLFIKSYYSLEQDEECVRKPAGAIKALCMQRCLERVREDLRRLQRLGCPHLVSAVGINFCPPSLALEAAPHGPLSRLLQSGALTLTLPQLHCIALQVLCAMDFFHGKELSFHRLDLSTVLVWSLDSMQVKLTDDGITHRSSSCELCAHLKLIPSERERWAKACQMDYILLGLLCYELAVGRRAMAAVLPLPLTVLALLHSKLQLSIEADLRSRAQEREEEARVVGCHHLCLQSTLEQCVGPHPLSLSQLQSRFRLCAGDHTWSPMRVTLNVECMVCSDDGQLVYWASGSKGLVTGSLEPAGGRLQSSVLQEAPLPESGLFANRRAKPVPIAVGRATVVALVEATQQLWVGTENGSVGSVYVFNLPEMRQHHYIHLQDAVLSIAAVNRQGEKFGGPEMRYRVLVGLANGTIILFLGQNQGKTLENPLQGPKVIVRTYGRKPCLNLSLTRDGHIWCSCGDAIEMLDMVSLKSVRCIMPHAAPAMEGGERVKLGGGQGPQSLVRGDVITLMAVTRMGVWTVGRRSSLLRLWNQISGELRGSYNVHNTLKGEDDITALSIQGQAAWLGTRSGYVMLLDTTALAENREALLGLQFCGEGRVKGIIALGPRTALTTRIDVLCSLEYPDEVSGALMVWEYQPQQVHRPIPVPHRIETATGHHRSNLSLPPPSPSKAVAQPPEPHHASTQHFKSL